MQQTTTKPKTETESVGWPHIKSIEFHWNNLELLLTRLEAIFHQIETILVIIKLINEQKI